MKGEQDMATIKCTKCGNTLILPKDKDTITCGFCGTTQKLSDANSAAEADRLAAQYAQLMRKANKYRDVRILTETADEFDRLGDYENSRKMAEYCRQVANEEQEKLEKEAARRKLEEQWRKKGQIRRYIIIGLIVILLIALLIPFTRFMNELVSEMGWSYP